MISFTLKKNWEFDRVLKRGRSSGGKDLVVYSCRSRRPDVRIGFCVSRKVGCAVVRNRIRRRLREIFRLHRTELTGGFDLLIMARQSSAASDYQSLDRGFLELCKKLGVWRGET